VLSMSRMTRRRLASVLLSLPPPLLAVALMAANFGAMWALAVSGGLLHVDATKASARLQDVCTAIALLIVLLMACRGYLLGWRAWFREACSLQFQPFYAAGLMSIFADAAWVFLRSNERMCILVWTAALIAMLIGQVLFLRHILIDVRARPPGVSVLKQLWTSGVPPWFVPLVGIAAASATGGPLVHATSSSNVATEVALYGPLALGGLWATLLLPPLYAKAIRTGSLWTAPPSAVLMAPSALILAGWLGAAGPNVARHDSWLTHTLAVIVLITAAPIVLNAPRYLYPCKPFSLPIASVGFPLEIGAIALTRYQSTLVVSGANGVEDQSGRTFWRAASWVLITWASMAALIIGARYAAYVAVAALSNAPPTPAVPADTMNADSQKAPEAKGGGVSSAVDGIELHSLESA